MIIFFIDWLVLGAIFLFSLLGSAFALEKVVSFLLGPAKWVAIVLLVLVAIGYICVSLFSDTGGSFISKVAGCIFNSISNVIRNGLNVVFMLCVLVGFLQNMDHGGLFHVLWGLFALLGDSLVLMLFLCASMFIDGYAVTLSDKIPVALEGFLNFAISLIYCFFVQCILKKFYSGTVEALFAQSTELSKFILMPWLFRFL